MSTTKIRSGLDLLAGLLLLMTSGSALAGPFLGINYGPFHHGGQAPGTLISHEQFRSDLGIISSKFTYIKTYGDDTPSGLDQVVPIAATHFPKLRVYQGVYEDSAYNSSNNTTFLDTAISLANRYPKTVVAVVVGNECLLTDTPNGISVSQLVADLQYVRERLENTGVQVTTELEYGDAGNPDITTQLEHYVDSIMINIYPFYGPVPIGDHDAINNLIGTYYMFNQMFAGKEVIIGETGWPSAGAENKAAVPSVAHEATYTRQIFANSNQLGSTFLFEAFDEPWLVAQNSWGPHWGLWHADGAPKFSFNAMAKELKDRFTSAAIAGPSRE